MSTEGAGKTLYFTKPIKLENNDLREIDEDYADRIHIQNYLET